MASTNPQRWAPATSLRPSGIPGKLAAALRLLERGKTKAAGNVIGAFLNQVEALMRSRRLPEADARPLRDQAACVRTQLHG